MATDDEAIDWTQGWETGAYDSDCVLDDCPGRGIDIGPAGVFVGESFDYYRAVGAGYADAEMRRSMLAYLFRSELWLLNRKFSTYKPLRRKIPTS